jgi:hypothetical protein
MKNREYVACTEMSSIKIIQIADIIKRNSWFIHLKNVSLLYKNILSLSNSADFIRIFKMIDNDSGPLMLPLVLL